MIWTVVAGECQSQKKLVSCIFRFETIFDCDLTSRHKRAAVLYEGVPL
jgi:hypothetical protein